MKREGYYSLKCGDKVYEGQLMTEEIKDLKEILKL